MTIAFKCFKLKIKIIILLITFFNLVTLAQGEYKLIDIRGFWDSSHHWYDINDEEKTIYPLPDQQKYKLTDITKIADNILLFSIRNW